MWRISIPLALLLLAAQGGLAENRFLKQEVVSRFTRARSSCQPALLATRLGGSAESIGEAAKRELREETGYAAEQVEILCTGPASSGVTSEVVTLLRASGLKRVNGGGGVAHEKITVHEVPLWEVHEWLAARATEGLLIEPKVYTGLYFVERRQGGQRGPLRLHFGYPRPNDPQISEATI